MRRGVGCLVAEPEVPGNGLMERDCGLPRGRQDRRIWISVIFMGVILRVLLETITD